MGILVSYIGRLAIVPFDQNIFQENKISYHLWPDICYNRNRPSRFTHFMLSSHQSAFRNQPNAPFNTLNVTLHKNHFSQYFFQTCISDGQKRLSHNYPISISLIQNDLNNMIKLSEDKYLLKKEWFQDKEIRLFSFNNMINNKFHHLDTMMNIILEKRLHSINEHGLKMLNLLEYVDKHTTSSNEFSKGIRQYIKSYHLSKTRIKKNYDIRLGNTLRKQSNLTKNESPWLINQKENNDVSSKISRNYVTRWKINKKRLNRLKHIISKLNIKSLYFDLYKVIPVWKSRSNYASFAYEFDLLRQNLKRRKRNKFFMRSIAPGATFGRSRNTVGLFFEFLETKPRSSFFLRAKEVRIDSKDNLNSPQRISQTEAEKFDFSGSHSSRGPALVTQLFIRKYIKLPILIIGKSLVRLVLMHTSEWNQDWTEWSQEQYVYCYYDGNYVPGNEIPPNWLAEGLQIQILSPFSLTPWRPSLHNKDLLLENKNQLFLKSSYINIWGQETDVPFGTIQNTSFFKPIIKGLILFSRYQLGRILRIINQLWFSFHKQYKFVQSQFYNKMKTFDKRTSRNTSDLRKNDTNSFLEPQMMVEKSKLLPHDLKNKNQNLFLIETDVNKHLISEDKIDIPNLEKSNAKTQIKKEIDNRDSILLTQNIASKSRLMEVNNDTFIYKNNDSFIKQSIKINQLSIFPNNFIIQQTTKFVEYQIIKIRIFFLRLYQNLIYTKKYFYREIIKLIRIFQIKMFQLKKDIIIALTNIISKIENNLFSLKTNIIIFLNNKTVFSKRVNNRKDSLSYSFNSLQENTNLSHAYILHKIWQNNFPNRLPIQEIDINWKANNLLKSDIQMILNEYGLFQNNPKNINVNNLNEWLRPFRRYTPSPELWNQLSPNIWRDSVSQFWVNNSLNIENIKYKTKNYTDKSSRYLSYFKPLFEKSNKMTKRWQVSLLINSYTNSLKNDHLHDILRGWQTQNRKNIQLFHRNLIQENLDRKKNILISKSLTWGLTNIRNNGLVVSFPLIKSFNGSFISKANNYMYNKQPIYIKYTTTSLAKEENLFLTFKQRVSFRPIMQYKWKSEQDRFKVLNNINIINKVKSDLNNAIQNTTLANKNKGKSLSTFEDKVEQIKLQWKMLSPLTFQTIRKRQAKMVDDEMLMHTIITSFFKFKNKYLNTKKLVLLNSSLNQLFLTETFLPKYSLIIPEDLLLAKTLREYRILSSFQFISENPIDNLNKMVNLNQMQKFEHSPNRGIESLSHQSIRKTYQELSSHQMIKRYLWPSYRVEDLACMNRYWINTANQARFSNLRIRMYPTLDR
jgi:hypothetical protein